jgi:YVTN family beta-propeller protein
LTIFSPDGKYGYVCSSFTPETNVITVADHKIVGKVPQASAFCPNIAATPDSSQVWFTLKDTGKTQVFNAQPPFNLLKTLDTGPISNHVNIVRNANGMFAYVTVGGLNEIKVFRTDNFEQVATIPTGKLPHGIWPSGDGTRVYVGLENEDRVAAIDTLTNTVIATSPSGQAAQAVVYVPNAVPEGPGIQGLRPLGIAALSTQLLLAPAGRKVEKAPTSISLSDQGLVQVLEAAVTGLEPGKPYLLALSSESSGVGILEPLQGFMTNPAGSAIINAIGPIRQVVRGEDRIQRRYLVIAPGTADQHGPPVQVQLSEPSDR